MRDKSEAQIIHYIGEAVDVNAVTGLTCCGLVITQFECNRRVTLMVVAEVDIKVWTATLCQKRRN
jgi:hypothetical protein